MIVSTNEVNEHSYTWKKEYSERTGKGGAKRGRNGMQDQVCQDSTTWIISNLTEL